MGRELFARARIATRMLTHTYTRLPRVAVVDDPNTPAVDESVDSWNQPVEIEAAAAGQPATAAIPITGVRCLFKDAGRGNVGPDGLTHLTDPTLYLAGDDPLVDGDHVTDVRDKYGNALFSGEALVTDITEVSPHGAVVYRIASLTTVEQM